MRKLVRSAGLANTSSGSLPNTTGSHSASGTGRRVHSKAVSRPSQNSHCGVSGWCTRMASSASSSVSSVAEVASSRSVSALGVASVLMARS